MTPVFVTSYWAFETSRSQFYVHADSENQMYQVLKPAGVGSCVSVNLNFPIVWLYRFLIQSTGAVVMTGKSYVFVYLTQRKVQSVTGTFVFNNLLLFLS
jgi:hypothetical protein